MCGPEHPRIPSERGDDVLDDLARVNAVGFLVRHVKVITADEPYAQHDLRHSQQPRRPGSSNWAAYDLAMCAPFLVAKPRDRDVVACRFGPELFVVGTEGRYGAGPPERSAS